MGNVMQSNIFSRGPVLFQRSLRCCHRARSACTNARLRRSATSAQTRTSASRDAAAGRHDTPPLDETLLAAPEVAVQQIAASTLATLNKRNAVSAPIASGALFHCLLARVTSSAPGVQYYAMCTLCSIIVSDDISCAVLEPAQLCWR